MSARPAAPLRRKTVFAIIALALLMMALDSTIVATALHAIEQGLDTSLALAGWTITAYSFGFVLMLPISGKLAERYGRKRLFIGSTAAFMLASLGCATADSIHSLIILRALQAAGGAGFTPSATGIIVEHFGRARDRYVSLFGSIFPIGAMAGPIFGGYFVTYMSWRDVFYVNVPIAFVILLLALRFLPADIKRASSAYKPMDLPGIGLLGGALLLGMLAVTALSGQELRYSLPLAALCAGLSAVLSRAFVRHIKGSGAPFIAPRLIYGPSFGAVNLANMVFGGMVIGAMALVPLYAVNRYELSAVSSGSLLTAQGAAAMVCSLLAVMALRSSGYRLPLYIGSILASVGLFLLALSPWFGIPAYFWLAFAAFLVGAGNGTINPAMRNAGLQLEPQSSSMLAALRTLSMQFGSIVTISLATAVLAHVEDVGWAMAWFYIVVALIRFAAVPLIARIPEQKGAW